ncbi:type II toxin-antitoxin system VapC family toxin [Candidatus Pacearchaeota archaeon]|nr:type II toxin-antitoxin system VapC family toxin [Candidatus Pacearchaeota archaeon]
MDKKYLDANVFIQGILREDTKYKEVILRMARKEFVGVTSILSWDEIVFVVGKFLGREVAKREGKKFFGLPNLELIDVKREVILKAQKLIEKYNLKPRDAIHSVTAISLGIKEIISEDADFDKINELKRISPESYRK